MLSLGAEVRSLIGDYLETRCPGLNSKVLLDRIERLSALLALWGTRMNLTAEPRDPHQLAFHTIDSLTPLILAQNDESLREAFQAGNRLLDLGSGAGYPGLVLASSSSASFTLTESRRKRASFLTLAAAEMNLENVTVAPHRIPSRRAGSNQKSEDLWSDSEARFDVVTARAYALPLTFYSSAAYMLRSGGVAILYASPGQDLALPHAPENGLHEFRSLRYKVPRGNCSVNRILALWRRA